MFTAEFFETRAAKAREAQSTVSSFFESVEGEVQHPRVNWMPSCLKWPQHLPPSSSTTPPQPMPSSSSGEQVEEGQGTPSSGRCPLPLHPRWATLSLVPERAVAGLVTRTWDRRALKQRPRVTAKKCKAPVLVTAPPPAMLREASGGGEGRKPQPGLHYGRLRRPRQPPAKKKGATDTSSSSSDQGEESSCGEEDNEEQDEQMGAEEEDKKEICIQVKLGKEEKVKPCLEKPQPDANWFIWDGIRGTRANQDYQREVEDSSLLDIQSHLAGRRQGKLVRVATSDASSYTTGGTFLRLEQDWRDSHMAYLQVTPGHPATLPPLQHKTALSRASRPCSAGESLPPP